MPLIQHIMQNLGMGTFTFVEEKTDQEDIKLCGSAEFEAVLKHRFQYEIGSTVFIKSKAEKGQLEKIAIKKVYLTGKSWSYVDTTNRVWLENELITHEKAVKLARSYWLKFMK